MLLLLVISTNLGGFIFAFEFLVDMLWIHYRRYFLDSLTIYIAGDLRALLVIVGCFTGIQCRLSHVWLFNCQFEHFLPVVPKQNVGPIIIHA